jgi:hypothetical protein
MKIGAQSRLVDEATAADHIDRIRQGDRLSERARHSSSMKMPRLAY